VGLAILADRTEVKSFDLADGFFSHRFQQFPAVEHDISELILGKALAQNLFFFSREGIFENRPRCEGGIVYPCRTASDG
jgi:hypothetical protein